MTARFDSFQQTVAVFSALFFTAAVVIASAPYVPVA
jgi:hypothetical protein